MGASRGGSNRSRTCRGNVIEDAPVHPEPDRGVHWGMLDAGTLQRSCLDGGKHPEGRSKDFGADEISKHALKEELRGLDAVGGKLFWKSLVFVELDELLDPFTHLAQLHRVKAAAEAVGVAVRVILYPVAAKSLLFGEPSRNLLIGLDWRDLGWIGNGELQHVVLQLGNASFILPFSLTKLIPPLFPAYIVVLLELVKLAQQLLVFRQQIPLGALQSGDSLIQAAVLEQKFLVGVGWWLLYWSSSILAPDLGQISVHPAASQFALGGWASLASWPFGSQIPRTSGLAVSRLRPVPWRRGVISVGTHAAISLLPCIFILGPRTGF